MHLLGRLKPGVTDAQAEADLDPIIADLKKREPTQFPEKWRVGLLPFSETFRSGITGDLWVLFGAVGAAAADCLRERLEPAAVEGDGPAARDDASGSRSVPAGSALVRQLLTESLLLALAAGVAGVALAYAGLPAILALVPPDTIPDEAEIANQHAGAALHARDRGRDERRLRPGAGASQLAARPRDDDARGQPQRRRERPARRCCASARRRGGGAVADAARRRRACSSARSSRWSGSISAYPAGTVF